MINKTVPNIAILGFSLEANRQAPVSDRKAFVGSQYLDADEIKKEMEGDLEGLRGDVRGFFSTMSNNGAWNAVPILLAEALPGGPADHEFFLEMLETMRVGLSDAPSVDGVFISEHGAGLTTEDDDPDGIVFSMVREVVGPNIPIIAVLDLHGHVTPRMRASADVMIAYLTNPHVDQFERGEEAAETMISMLGGMQTSSTLVRVPMISPAVSLLTKQGPYADLIRYGQTLLNESIVNISILAGFAPANASTNGMSIVVTAKGINLVSKDTAQKTANYIAEKAWSDRGRYTTNLIKFDKMIELSKSVLNEPDRPGIIIADVADNPGGGGRGNTVYVLRRMIEEKTINATIGMMIDPALAEEAHQLGLGIKFRARFNRHESTKYSEKFETDATIINLVKGNCVGRRGVYAGRRTDLGLCALLKIGDIKVMVASERHQLADPAFIEIMGIDISKERVLVVKSRGHFRAGFDEYHDANQIFEVDAPGLTTPNLTQLDLSRVPRPIFPLDPEMKWNVPKV